MKKPVFCSGNPRRLLGMYLVPRDFSLAQGCRFRVALPPSRFIEDYILDPRKLPSQYSIELETIDFHFAWRATDNGWTKKAVLETDASLQQLLRLREFFIPKSEAECAF